MLSDFHSKFLYKARRAIREDGGGVTAAGVVAQDRSGLGSSDYGGGAGMFAVRAPHKPLPTWGRNSLRPPINGEPSV